MAKIPGNARGPTKIPDPVDPNDVDNFSLDFSKELATGENIASAVSRVDKAGNGGDIGDVTINLTDIQGSIVVVQAKGWKNGASYTIAVTITTDAIAPRVLERSFTVSATQL